MTTTTNGSGPRRTGPLRTAGPPRAGDEPGRPLPVAPRASLPRARRRPALLALGVALMALGILTGAWLVNTAGERESVLAVARTLPYGEVITERDLIRAEVSVDAAVATIPASDLEQVVGRVAGATLTRGTLLAPSALTDTAPPAAGEVLVGIALPASRMPAGSLLAGDRVLVVDTPPAEADAPTLPPATIPATVVRLGEPDLNGLTVVDVTVSSPDGPALAARSATGRIALVLQPRTR